MSMNGFKVCLLHFLFYFENDSLDKRRIQRDIDSSLTRSIKDRCSFFLFLDKSL